MIGLIAFSDLLSEKTLAAWKQTIVNTATLVGLKTENWAEGGYTRTLVALFGQLYKTAGDVVRLIAASGFLDTATGAWLTLLAKEVFNVDRIEATYANADDGLTLTNGGGGLYIFEPGDIVAANGAGKTYRNTSGGTLSPGGLLNVDLQAEEAGVDSTSGVGTITVLVTTFLGVTVSNDVALTGLDEERDSALRLRCRASLALLAVGGIKRAYEFIARSAKRPDGTSVGVTRVGIVPPPGNGTMDVYIASASGAVSSPDVAIVQAEFDRKSIPYGFDATTISAANLSVTAPCTIWIPSSLGITETEARAAVYNALSSYVQTLPIGGIIISPAAGKVYWRALLGVVEGAIAGMLKAELTSEANIDVSVDEVPVWAGTLTDTTVIQVAG